MRIVGGKLSGRRFGGPTTDGTRPTSERVREGVSSALESRNAFQDACVLDLFAGTGALAFEALSRGAKSAVLVEKNRRLTRTVATSATQLGLDAMTEIIVGDLLRQRAKVWTKLRGPFDLVFLDPPYAEIQVIPELLSELEAVQLIHSDSFIVVEFARRDPPSFPRNFQELASYRYGDTGIVIRKPSEG